jgi:hypothetical protein
LVARIELVADAADEEADETELIALRIAQLAFGVSSGLGFTERVDRLDRAAVAILHPPPGTGTPIGLVDDGFEFFSRHAPELPIEIGGTICRMLIDRNVLVRIGEVELRVSSDETFHLSTTDRDRSWDSPVQVDRPARVAAKALKKAGLTIKQIRASAVAQWVTPGNSARESDIILERGCGQAHQDPSIVDSQP